MESEGQRSERELRRAIDLVLRDVAAVLGDGAVAIVKDDGVGRRSLADVIAAEPELREIFARTPGLLEKSTRAEATAAWWVIVPGEQSRVGLSNWNYPPFADLVERTAETVQEVIMESERFFGTAFPPCPEHSNSPLWAKLVNGQAVWSCIDGGVTTIPIGTLAPPQSP